MTNQDRTRIYSHITRTRFLHLEDALTPPAPDKPGKIRFFVGEYIKGQGSSQTAYHFLDDADARVVFTDMSWGKALDIKDYKGSANGGGQPLSRVLKIQGPKDGKYWVEVQNGPGQVIGAGAVKPAGDPAASISIALSVHEARKLALAVIEYMAAFRVAALLGATPTAAVEAPACNAVASLQNNKATPSPGQSDIEDLFGPDQPAAPAPASAPAGSQSGSGSQTKANKETTEDGPPAFYALAPVAIRDHGLADLVNQLVRAPGSWREKSVKLQAAMAN